MLAGLSFVAISALATLVSAQGENGTQPTSTYMPVVATQGFNIGSTSSTDRFNWCHSQQIVCPQICGFQGTTANTCDQTTLTYSCTCTNGTSPDVTAYENSLPFYICQATFVQCIQNHPMDAQGQATCTSNEKCGTLNSTTLSTTSASSSAAASSTSAASSGSSTGSPTSSGAASGTGSSASSTSSSAAIANLMTAQVGTGAFAALLLAVLGLAL